MKTFLMLFVLVALLSTACAAEKAAKAPTLRDIVSEREDAFLAQLENAVDPEPVFAAYEAELQALVRKHPGAAEPSFGYLELFEKCDTARTVRLLDEMLKRTDLAPKVREAFEKNRQLVKLIGQPITTELTALDGRPVRFGEWKGRVVLVDFWATWCGPCVRDLPKLQALQAKHQPALAVVGISFDRERAKLDSFLRTRHLPWRQVFVDESVRSTVERDLGVTGGFLPVVFLVGKDGRIRHTLNSRFRTEAKVEALLRE